MAIESSKILGLLSNLYLCKPTIEAIKNWKALLSEDVPPSLSKLKVAIDKIDLRSEKELEDLLWEYTRLFIGPYKLPCPPWESVYTSAKRLMMQEAFDEVQEFYTEAGLKIDDPDIMPDHIGAELNFLAILIQKMDSELGKRDDYLNLIKRFLEEHLTRWIPQFSQEMEMAVCSSFYKELARVTRDFILSEHNILNGVAKLTISSETEASDHVQTV